MSDIDLTLQQIAREEEEKFVKDAAEKAGLPYISLVDYPIAPDVLALIPHEQAINHQAIAFLMDEAGEVSVASTNPKDKALEQFLAERSKAVGKQFKIHYCSESSLQYGLSLYKVLLTEAPKEEKVQVTQEKQAQFEAEMKTLQSFREKINEVSTTEILDFVFAGAIKNDASDIHIEPEEKDCRIRFRIDGVLQDVAHLPTETFKHLISRIKFLAKLKYDITHPQDGRFAIQVLASEVDIRVATLPTSYGESVVMRLLPKKKKFVTLEDLGFNKSALEIINEAISKPQGMILNTGPTGSGKTTTLYAILQKLNEPGKKIITIENPIEYRVEGIEQIQIDPENKTGWLDVLKGALRQDPDVMMVGEIRDGETANIALQAAMTGHLVLSTLHTNNAPSSLARLSEMGVPKYLLGGSINLIIAQRLVRTLHDVCKGKGCPECHQTGFKGRQAIVEVLTPGKEIEELIQKEAPIRTFEETAHKLGMKTMYEDGMEKVAKGVTTKEEVERVTKE